MVAKAFKLSPIPPDFFDRFPDGNYTVGRGADPRRHDEIAADKKTERSAVAEKSIKRKAKAKTPGKRAGRAAAE